MITIIIVLSIMIKLVILTSQISALSKSSVWIECHERMARWFVLMDHYMKNERGMYGHWDGRNKGNGTEGWRVIERAKERYKNR